jgi:hypothetical protein
MKFYEAAVGDLTLPAMKGRWGSRSLTVSNRGWQCLAISNNRLIDFADDTVSFHWKDYRQASCQKVMSLAAHEFMRRFMLHVLPCGF